MDAILGSWKMSKATNQDAFLLAAGVPQDKLEVYKQREEVWTYFKEGSAMKCTVKMVNAPEPMEKTYQMEFDQVQDVESIDGHKMQIKTSFDGSKFVETITVEGKELHITREVKDDVIHEATECDGVVMTQEWVRC